MKNSVVKLNEMQLRKLISRTIMESLEEQSYKDSWDDFEEGFYVCCVGNYGDVEVWVTDDPNEAQEASMASEGSVYGPFGSYEEADEAADAEVHDGYDNGYHRVDKQLDENKVRKVVSKVIKESLRKSGRRKLNEDAGYMAILQKNGFQAMQAEDDIEWASGSVGQNGSFFISVLTSEGWFHSRLYNCNEGTIFRVAEKLTNALKQMGWIEDAMGAAQSMGATEDYTDIAYIEGIWPRTSGEGFDDEEDDDYYSYTSDGKYISDTIGEYLVDQDGYGFWND